MKTFEEYLQEVHAADYHGTDDDMPGAFDYWLSELQIDEIIQYAEDWGKTFVEKEDAIDAQVKQSVEDNYHSHEEYRR